MKKKLITALLLCTLTMLLCACGQKVEVHTDRYIGVYAGSDEKYAPIENGEEASYVDLSDNGTCICSFAGQVSAGSWKTENDVITLGFADRELKGSFETGVIRLELPGDGEAGLMVCFAMKGFEPTIPEPEADAEEPEATEPQEEPEDDTFVELADSTDWWQGCWYGWWTMYRQEGDYETLESDWWDLCAEISFDQYGMRMLLWDEDGSSSEPAGMVRFSLLTNEETGAWYAYSKSGSFFKDEISRGEWILDPSQTGYPDTLILNAGQCEDGYGSYRYHFVLRPWGYSWSAVEGDPSETILFDEVLPAHYEDWYLPLVESGAPMPESIGG